MQAILDLKHRSQLKLLSPMILGTSRTHYIKNFMNRSKPVSNRFMGGLLKLLSLMTNGSSKIQCDLRIHELTPFSLDLN